MSVRFHAWNPARAQIYSRYDDGAVVKKNPDVVGNTSIDELFIHDFWGRAIHEDRSHKS